MEKILKLYTYVDGVNDVPFPSEEEHIELYSFNYDAKRMGGAPTITATKKHRLCLDDRWTYNVYAEYRGERYFLKQIPTSSYSNEDSRYKHEIELVSERIILDNVYFYDVVTKNVENDKYVSNSSSVTFFGDIQEFAKRLNHSLSYSKVGYTVVVDEGISSEPKLMSFENQYFSNVLQEIFNIYEIPYYFVGKTIHIGFTSNAITHTFKYGAKNALLSIVKNNANNKVVNRITGVGSSDNIPYYYPNPTESGTLELKTTGRVAATITNEIVFNRKARLSNKFICETIKKDVIPDIWTTWDNAFSSPMSGQHVNVKYVLPFNEGTKVKIVFTNTYTNIESLTARVNPYLTISDEITRVFNEGGGEITVPKNGWISLDIKLKEDDYENGLSDVKQSISLECETINLFGWTLNGSSVNLADYGISVNNENIGDTIGYNQLSYIPPQQNLMPPIYREKGGDERFYNALNDTYISPQTNDYYRFNNPYIDGKPKEHSVEFNNIKPTIVGMVNANGQRMDTILDIAFDTYDNDDTDENGNFLHPYFFVKLPKYDGEYGFNLFDHTIEEDEMVISMTSGSCGACNFPIMVSEDTQKNMVQVDAFGNLVRNKNNGKVLFGTPQAEQNDTVNNEVWIALKKDIDTFGVVMPNATNKYEPSVGDTFVILHIDLPQAYIESAENKLKEELIKYMAMNNDEKFNFSITFSRIFFAENESIRNLLDENARLQLEYNDKEHELYVSSYSYKVNENQALPEVSVELSDTLTISQNAIQNAVSEVKQDIMSSVGSIDWLKLGLAYFLRKDVDDVARGNITFEKNVNIGGTIKSKNFHKGNITGRGWAAYEEGEDSVIEADKLIARKIFTVNELVINQISFTQGETVFSNGGCTVTVVEEYEDYYRCYYDNKNGQRYSGFEIGDGARCQEYNNNYSEGLRYYWRKVVAVGGDFIDLSKTSCDEGSVAPREGDNIVQFGHENVVARQNAITIDAGNSPKIYQYVGITLFSVPEPQTKIEPNNNQFSGIVNFKSGSTGAENIADLPQEVQSVVNDLEFGKANLLRNTSFTGDYLSKQLDDSSALGGDSEMFSPSLEHWDVLNGNPTVVERAEAVSGFGLNLPQNSGVRQTLLDKILPNESYVLSYNLNGYEPTFSIGGYHHSNVHTSAVSKKVVVVFKAVSDTNTFELKQLQSGCTISNIQLERGTIPSTYGRSVYDNESSLAYYDKLKYVSDAIENGQTTFLGGLILSNIIQLGKWNKDKTSFQNASGMSGYNEEGKDVAFWGGGDYDKALATVAKYAANPTYVPSEAELKTLAKYVVTHGGRVIMQDAIVRGTVYADSGRFTGIVEAESGYFNGEVNATSGKFKGRIEATEGFFNGEVKQANGKTLLSTDGSGQLADGNIKWNESGMTSFNGGLSLSQDYRIIPYVISDGTLEGIDTIQLQTSYTFVVCTVDQKDFVLVLPPIPSNGQIYTIRNISAKKVRIGLPYTGGTHIQLREKLLGADEYVFELGAYSTVEFMFTNSITYKDSGIWMIINKYEF